jgi:hypothetical protein
MRCTARRTSVPLISVVALVVGGCGSSGSGTANQEIRGTTSGQFVTGAPLPTCSPLRSNPNVTPVHDARDSAVNRVYYQLSVEATEKSDGCYRRYALAIVEFRSDDTQSRFEPDAVHKHVRVWLCGQRRSDLDVDSTEKGTVYTAYIKDGACGPQADDLGSDAYSRSWTPEQHVFVTAEVP